MVRSQVMPMRRPNRQPAPRRLQRWQRVAITTALLLALAIGVTLVVFQPGTRTFTLAQPTAPASNGTDTPRYPPGTRYYYRRGQWVPYDQQEAPTP
jgi:hypothetical protein